MINTDSLIANPTGLADNICNDGILFMRDFAHTWGMTYSEANILLFMIIMPTLILYFMILSVMNNKIKSKKLTIVTYVSIIITILIPVIILLGNILTVTLSEFPH